ncbi:hypothetical protein [Mesobacillus foraminis]|uniref:hypothetical protein n=1 Tax=Mesobacillus foraminis TaxID=279826 RepID=UPI001304F90D|nr:hypothetical protein [Mesobacillus foraminis]
MSQIGPVGLVFRKRLITIIGLVVQFENLLIGVEGAQTPPGSAGQLRPRRSLRRGGLAPAPRKAKRLETNSTAHFVH